jgi:hypothetical protein
MTAHSVFMVLVMAARDRYRARRGRFRVSADNDSIRTIVGGVLWKQAKLPAIHKAFHDMAANFFGGKRCAQQ